MSVLDTIVRDKRDELRRRQAAVPLSRLESRCRDLGPARDFEDALRPAGAGPVRLIAEVKQASPSRGVLVASFDPVALARAYADHGADAISVLTDEKHFRGSLDHLVAIRAAVTVPLLRKDFTLDEYQLWEARAAGADAALLIVAILEPSRLRDLVQAAKGVGLAALVECHTPAELETALGAGARILGINNRDLRTFTTRLETTLELLPLIPPGPLVVSESGFFTGADVRRVVAAGAHAILVGESLLTAQDRAAKIRELKSTGSLPAARAGGEMGEAPSHPTRAGGEMGGAPSHPTRAGGEMGEAPSHPTRAGGEMGGAPSHPTRAGGEMGGASRPTHSS